MSANPSFVFTYLPAPVKPAALNDNTTQQPTLYDQSAAFLQSARKAFLAPRLTAEESQIATLDQTRVHLSEHAALKAKAGMSSGEPEVDQIRTVEKALVELRK